MAQEFNLHAHQIVEWKQQMQERAAEVFGGGAASRQPAQPDIKVLHAKIGQPTLENDFLEGALTKAGLLQQSHAIHYGINPVWNCQSARR